MMATEPIQGSYGSPEWRLELLGLLHASGAPRVCTTQDIAHLLRQVRPRATATTLHSVIEGLRHAGALQKVSRGLFLNRSARLFVNMFEVAAHIRVGALVSLQTVLGECGFLNNPSNWVTAVLPQSPTRTPRVGRVITSAGLVLRFHALAPRFFASSLEERRLQLQIGRHCDIARPEAAALHWLHLWKSPRSSMLKPPQDVDFDALDSELLDYLAVRWGLDAALQAWKSEVSALGDIQEPAPFEGLVTEELRQRGRDARARMLARRNSRK